MLACIRPAASMVLLGPGSSPPGEARLSVHLAGHHVRLLGDRLIESLDALHSTRKL
jgi:hypothetical protein